MKIYNTLTRKLEEFIPHEEGIVKLYTCGPTVYDYAHIGNLRTYISEDILEKSLMLLGYQVDRAMNITDVGHLVNDADSGDDKMSVAAKRENKSALEIARFYTEAFFKDTERLNIKRPRYVEKATDHIKDYIKIIEKLLNDGYAYLANGNVYFDTSKYNDYYHLSLRNKDDLLVGARDDVLEDEYKKNQADFGLWFTNSKFDNQELKWDSPWGAGYPGWHIECSAISLVTLGEYLDIHCGAVDAIFPHHTNEIAQSECFLGHKWCNYWVHMEFLNDATGKMSKSKGDFLTLQSLIDKGYDPLAYRFMCLQSHYRNQMVFTYENLDNANVAYKKIKGKILSLEDVGDVNLEDAKVYLDKFKDALANDLNTSLAITILYDTLKADLNDATKRYLIGEYDKVFSLDLLKREEIDVMLKQMIEEKILEREIAKKAKDYEQADAIRDELKAQGILIKDTRDGTVYEII